MNQNDLIEADILLALHDLTNAIQWDLAFSCWNLGYRINSFLENSALFASNLSFFEVQLLGLTCILKPDLKITMIRLPTVAHFRQNLATVRDFGGEVQITWRFSLSEELYRADTIQASTYITQFPYYQSQSGTGLEMLQRLEMCLLWEARKH